MKNNIKKIFTMLLVLVMALTLLPTISFATSSPISPVLEGVTNNNDGTYTVHWGYNNPNSYEVTINNGGSNEFVGNSPNPANPITVFMPGRNIDAFQTVINAEGGNLVWKLNGKTATANSGSKEFTPSYVLTVNIVGDGTVSYSPAPWMVNGSMRFNKDTVVTLTPSAGSGYQFIGFEGATVVDNKITITADTTITAVFAKKISPVLEGVDINPDGTYTVHWGYSNPNDFTVLSRVS